MKLDSKNINMKFANDVIKKAHEINSEKEYSQIKIRDYIDRRVTSSAFFFWYFIDWGCL